MANIFVISIRLLKAVSLLSSTNGATIKKLMENLNISRRSVFRLLHTFEELGFPLIDEQSQSKKEKTYRLAETYVLKLPNIAIPNPNLTSEEIIFILSILETCKKYDILKDTKNCNSIKEKLIAMIQTRERK
jgi:predicted DNA-binding transcriptional regulator YafY